MSGVNSATHVDPSSDAFQQFDRNAGHAIGHGHGGEFALWLAAMGQQPVADEPPPTINWQREVGAARARPLGYNEPHVDVISGYYHAAAISDFKLMDALHPQPLIADSDPQRLPLELIANLDWQTRKRREQSKTEPVVPKRRRDPAKLYDVLQQLGIEPESSLM